jgi:hypothetical protein
MRLLLALLLLTASAAAQVPAAVPASAPSGAAGAALPWHGRGDAIAEFIRTAQIGRIEEIPVGVTKPRRALLTSGGPVSSIVVKDLRPGRKAGYWESYLSEIAAYELDRMLDLNMVPPTVEKRVNGTLMSAQMFVDETVWLKELAGERPPNVAGWNRQVYRQRVFDNLIANIDRNAGNLLVYRTPDWQLVLIDHSRCFTSSKKMPFEMTKIDRPFFEKLKALDEAALEARLGKLLVDGVDALLERRDAIVRHFEELAAAKGDAQVFVP